MMKQGCARSVAGQLSPGKKAGMVPKGGAMCQTGTLPHQQEVATEATHIYLYFIFILTGTNVGGWKMWLEVVAKESPWTCVYMGREALTFHVISLMNKKQSTQARCLPLHWTGFHLVSLTVNLTAFMILSKMSHWQKHKPMIHRLADWEAWEEPVCWHHFCDCLPVDGSPYQALPVALPGSVPWLLSHPHHTDGSCLLCSPRWTWRLLWCRWS